MASSNSSEAADMSSWMAAPHRIAVDGKGYVWRAYTDQEFWSMAPVNSDNSPIPQPVTYYVPEGERVALTEDERKAVLWAIGVGHRALDDGFMFPRDQNREILESARAKLKEQRDA